MSGNGGTTPSFPNASNDTTPASLARSGHMRRWATPSATIGGFTTTGIGTQQRLGVAPATASVAGVLTAADYTKLAAMKAPTFPLFASETTNLHNGTVFAANTYVTLVAAKNFTVASTTATLLAEVRLAVQVTGPAAVGAYVCEALLDGSGAVKLDSQILVATGLCYLHGNTFHITGFTAGTHTIELRCRSTVAGGTLFLRANTNAMYEYAEMRIAEYSL